MKFGSNFVFESNSERIVKFEFENYSATEMMTCDHLNIIEIMKLFDDSPEEYAKEPPVLQRDDMLIMEIPAQSLSYLFERKDYFDELYQSDLKALQQFYSTGSSNTLYEVATW